MMRMLKVMGKRKIKEVCMVVRLGGKTSQKKQKMCVERWWRWSG